MPARALCTGSVIVVLAALLVGCASGGEPGPTVTVTETVTPSPVPTLTSSPGAAPAPEEPLVDDVEAYATFTSADGAIAFAHPGSWTVRELPLPGLGTLVTLERSGGVIMLDIWVAPLQDVGPSICDASSADRSPMVVVESEPIDVLANGGATSAPALELATVELGDGLGGVAILQASHAGIDCLDLAVPVGSSTLVASTPWRGGSETLVYDAYPGGAIDFVGSFEHGRLLEVLRSLEISV